MSHNSDKPLPDSQENPQKDLPFRLTGSQAKTAHALRRNIDAMIAGNSPREFRKCADKDGKDTFQWIATKPENLDCCAFLTLTVGDTNENGDFEQVFDPAEASRRINNLNRRILPNLFERAIIVTERHKNGAIHFHIVGILKTRADIRSGFNFVALEKAISSRKNLDFPAAEKFTMRYALSATDELRGYWEMLRNTLPGYGFGRAELTPIKKTGEAVACYVSKYIEKNLFNRTAEDKHKKLVRYLGDWTTVKTHICEETGDFVRDELGNVMQTQKGSGELWKIRANDFGWCSKRATAWRYKARELAALSGIKEPEQAAILFGSRWAFHFKHIWTENCGDDLNNWLAWNENEFGECFARREAKDALDDLEAKQQKRILAAISSLKHGATFDEVAKKTHLKKAVLRSILANYESGKKQEAEENEFNRLLERETREHGREVNRLKKYHREKLATLRESINEPDYFAEKIFAASTCLN